MLDSPLLIEEVVAIVLFGFGWKLSICRSFTSLNFYLLYIVLALLLSISLVHKFLYVYCCYCCISYYLQIFIFLFTQLLEHMLLDLNVFTIYIVIPQDSLGMIKLSMWLIYITYNFLFLCTLIYMWNRGNIFAGYFKVSLSFGYSVISDT